LKERKKLILVPRETPLSLVHVKNFELLLLAGATILPANPSFYMRPQNIEQLVICTEHGAPTRRVSDCAERKIALDVNDSAD
jgi:3-polyprenyl-4-hydroxybenzoate decarboxylase